MTNITKGDVYNFVKENLVPVNRKRAACPDGRYPSEESQGATRVFGEDFGLALAFAAALREEGTRLLPNQIVERYYNAVKTIRGEDAELYYHTDEDHHVKGEKGCGHASNASNPANDGKYGVRSLEAENLYLTFARHPKSHLTVLQGKHEEEGVILVEGKTHSLHSRSNKNMFFVITPEQIDQLIDDISPIFSEGLENPVKPEDVKRNYLMQQEATASILGADKKPHYKVFINNKGHFQMEQLPKKK